jgi:hypothetical protein
MFRPRPAETPGTLAHGQASRQTLGTYPGPGGRHPEVFSVASQLRSARRPRRLSTAIGAAVAQTPARADSNPGRTTSAAADLRPKPQPLTSPSFRNVRLRTAGGPPGPRRTQPLPGTLATSVVPSLNTATISLLPERSAGSEQVQSAVLVAPTSAVIRGDLQRLVVADLRVRSAASSSNSARRHRPSATCWPGSPR